MTTKPIPEYTLQSRYHSTCADCKCGIVPGDMVRYTPATRTKHVTRQVTQANGHVLLQDMQVSANTVVRHAEGQCPAVMDYTVQLVYRCTSKHVKVRALSAEQAIQTATPKRTARETDTPCGYVVRQGNVEVLRRVA